MTWNLHPLPRPILICPNWTMPNASAVPCQRTECLTPSPLNLFGEQTCVQLTRHLSPLVSSSAFQRNPYQLKRLPGGRLQSTL
jgi:hypothetical protein